MAPLVRKKSQQDRANAQNVKKRFDERIRQHIVRFRVNGNNNNNTSTGANTSPINTATPIARDLTPSPTLHGSTNMLEMFPPSAFIDQIDPRQSMQGLTGVNQAVPSSFTPDQIAQNFVNPMPGIDFSNTTTQAVPNDSQSLELLFGQNIDGAHLYIDTQQPHHDHQYQYQQNIHPHSLQQWEVDPELFTSMATISTTPSSSHPVFQVNNQPATLSTTDVPQIVTQKPHKTPSRPDPPIFSNGPILVRASPDLFQHFSKFDTDGSGAISFDELQSCLTNKAPSRRRHFNNEVILALIEMFDNNRDGSIDISEFPELIAYLRNWNSCFEFLDEDHSGMLEYEEMHRAVSEMGLTVSHSLMKDIMAKYEYSEKNKIDLDNFILSCVSLYRFKETYEFMIETGGTTCKHIQLEDFLRTMLLSSGTMPSLSTPTIV